MCKSPSLPRMRFTALLFLSSLVLLSCRSEEAAPPACRALTFERAAFTVCTVTSGADIRLFHTAPDGEIYGQFDRLAEHMEADGTPLLFAMNGGMYHEDRRSVGLYVEGTEEIAPLVLGEGPGNFGMVPNGVFVYGGGAAGGMIVESEAYSKLAFRAAPHFATQSGPMLVINGALHPKFNADGPSKKRRNGVGITEDGQIHFAISDVPVNFHTFARLFRDELDTPNALYLDGVVSKLYSSELSRNEKGLDMGPIIGVVVREETEE